MYALVNDEYKKENVVGYSNFKYIELVHTTKWHKLLSISLNLAFFLIQFF